MMTGTSWMWMVGGRDDYLVLCFFLFLFSPSLFVLGQRDSANRRGRNLSGSDSDDDDLLEFLGRRFGWHGRGTRQTPSRG